ncbi:alpha-1,3-N-acetylgalactosamine transferase PglA [Algibacter lectus]|uniref:Alpha-1,3-N-acetylgalactosamine transferase PglA n=1 Tax=Algibacter lectus TaxID=221126 RepID=A0A090WKT5_9FLAO|nr:alpha-1,3-N-acetylgalactosamine transferase PglA [Algibacter lectus]
MELPCIVTDINGCNEIVDHEKTGLIIPVKDTEALLRAMETVLELGDASITMGEIM